MSGLGRKLLLTGLVTRVVIGDEPPLAVDMPFGTGLPMELVLEDEPPADLGWAVIQKMTRFTTAIT